MSSIASPPRPPKRSGIREGERPCTLHCHACDRAIPCFYQRASFDMVRCPHCRRWVLGIVGDIRESSLFAGEIRFLATGEEPKVSGHPSDPLWARPRDVTSTEAVVAFIRERWPFVAGAWVALLLMSAWCLWTIIGGAR